jgi:hypothetical protein
MSEHDGIPYTYIALYNGEEDLEHAEDEEDAEASALPPEVSTGEAGRPASPSSGGCMSSIKRLLDGDACHFFFDEQDHPWIRAADVCRKLGITNVGRALSRLKDSHKHHIITNDIVGKPHRI